MKKVLSALFALALIGIIISSCKKDDTGIDNFITIKGTFTVGDKTFTDPTFNLGTPEDLSAYLGHINAEEGFKKVKVEGEMIDLGDNFLLDYGLEVYSINPGSDLEMNAYLKVYQNGVLKGQMLDIKLTSGKAEITHIGEVGGYIEGAFNGEFSEFLEAKSSYQVTGQFKLKRIEEQVENYIDIQGQYSYDEKTYINPFFNLGSSDNLTAYLANYSKANTYNTIVLSNYEINLGDNLWMNNNVNIYSAVPGTNISGNASIGIYNSVPLKSGVYIYSNDLNITVTKVGEVGDYIEGTYEGDFYYDKKADAPFYVKAKFKAKRVQEPIY